MNSETLVGYEIEGYFPFKTGSAAVADCPVSVDLDHEGSLSWSPGRVAIELTTRPKSAKEAMKDIVTIFNWMKKTKAVTKHDCGLHINVGCPSKDPSWAAVLGLSRPRQVARKFDRQDSHWCEAPFSREVRDNLRRSLIPRSNVEKMAELSVLAARDPEAFGKRFAKQAAASVDRFMELNHRHSKSTPVVKRCSQYGVYFEFRTPGGAGYHLREKDVLWATKIFVKAVEGACETL